MSENNFLLEKIFNNTKGMNSKSIELKLKLIRKIQDNSVWTNLHYFLLSDNHNLPKAELKKKNSCSAVQYKNIHDFQFPSPPPPPHNLKKGWVLFIF